MLRGLPGHLDAPNVWLLKSRGDVPSAASGRAYSASSDIAVQIRTRTYTVPEALRGIPAAYDLGGEIDRGQRAWRGAAGHPGA
jgi:hypothetical protein